MEQLIHEEWTRPTRPKPSEQFWCLTPHKHGYCCICKRVLTMDNNPDDRAICPDCTPRAHVRRATS